MLYYNIMMSCARCLAGHRASPCQHTDRPLFAIKNKGRGSGGSSRLSQEPDFPLGINDPAVLIFHQTMMTDDRKYREYYHDMSGNQATSRQQTTPPNSRKQKSGANRVDDMYGGSLTPEEVDQWRWLCGYATMSPTIFEDPIPTLPMESYTNPEIDFDLTSFLDIPAVDDEMDVISEFTHLGDTTTDDSIATSDPIPETVDVFEAQRRHPHIRLPIAWSSHLEYLFEEGADQENTIPDEETN